jgi:hypothetical protein
MRVGDVLPQLAPVLISSRGETLWYNTVTHWFAVCRSMHLEQNKDPPDVAKREEDYATVILVR